LSEVQIERHGARTLEPAELVVVFDHLAACATCRERVAASQPFTTAFSRLAESLEAEAALENDHVAYEDLALLADDRLAGVELEIAAGHLTGCAPCARELDELRRLRLGVEQPLPAGPAAGSRTRGRRRFVLLAAGLSFASLAGWLVLRAALSPAPSAPSGPSALGAAPEGAPVTPTATLVDAGRALRLDPESLRDSFAWLPSRETLVRAVAEARMPQPVTPAGLASLGGVLRAEPEPGPSFTLASPVGEVVRSTQPALEWRPLTGAARYEAAVYDADYERVAQSPKLAATRWVVSPPLRRGASYTWEVTATLAGEKHLAPQPPDPEARIHVLEAAAEHELALAEARAPRSRLALGVLYARAGLSAEAERELTALAAANPGSSLAETLLRDASAQRRRKGALLPTTEKPAQ
jgi:hypothetical protein